MDEPQDKSPLLETEPDNAGLQQEVDALRHLVTSLLILLLVVSGTLNIFLLRMYRSTKNDLERFKPVAANVVMSYARGDGPTIENFVRSAVEFSKTHKDYEPILTKYGINAATVPPAPATVPTATPSATPPKK